VVTGIIVSHCIHAFWGRAITAARNILLPFFHDSIRLPPTHCEIKVSISLAPCTQQSEVLISD